MRDKYKSLSEEERKKMKNYQKNFREKMKNNISEEKREKMREYQKNYREKRRLNKNLYLLESLLESLSDSL